MARGRNLRRGGAAKAAEESTESKGVAESVEAQSEEVLADATAAEEAVEAPDAAIVETVEEMATDELSEGVKTEGEKSGTEKETPKKGNRKRFKQKKGKKAVSNDATPKEKKIIDFAGLIFMCNSETKKDCFKYRVFGLPEAKKNIVEQVKKGTKLFLFDIDKKVLHGVYKASSEGGMNLIEEAYKDSTRKFPAQVHFRIHKDCMPLEESVFKLAIKDNYFRGSKFKAELSSEQVGNLIRLFRPLDSRGQPEPQSATKREFAPKGKPARGPPPPRSRPRGPPPPRFPAPPPPRERVHNDYAPLYPRERLLSDLAPPSYGLVPDVTHAEAELLRQRHIRQAQEEALDRRGYLLDPVVEASLARKRYLDEVYAAEQQVLAAKRPLLPDPLYRDLEYAREAPYRSYADGLHSLSVGGLPYDPRAY